VNEQTEIVERAHSEGLLLRSIAERNDCPSKLVCLRIHFTLERKIVAAVQQFEETSPHEPSFHLTERSEENTRMLIFFVKS